MALVASPPMLHLVTKAWMLVLGSDFRSTTVSNTGFIVWLWVDDIGTLWVTSQGRLEDLVVCKFGLFQSLHWVEAIE